MLDTFQRYLEIYKFVQREADKSRNGTIRLLDVGSNGPGFAHYNRFKNVHQTNIDIFDTDKSVQDRFPEVEFLKYDGERLPFEDDFFDIAVCVDVLEHVPPEKRNSFLRDVIRISRNSIIFVFPVKTSERWEKFLSLITFHKIKFLEEHIEYGLPGEQVLYDAIRPLSGVRLVEELGNMNIWLWIPVKMISSLLNFFIKHQDDWIYKWFLFYQSTLSKIINWGRCYSKVFMLEKTNQL
jgi:hypothetical protein